MTTGITAKKIVQGGGMILLFVIIFGYGIWKARDIIFGIKLTVVGITDGMKADSELLSFSGRALHAGSITVDGRTVPAAQDGTWKDTIALLPGYNVVTISATDKFGRTNSTRYRVFYNAPEGAAVTAPSVTPPASDTTDTNKTPDGKKTNIPASTAPTPSAVNESGVQ